MALRAAELPSIQVERPRLGIPSVSRLGERHRRDPLARGERGQPALLLRIIARELDRETRERVAEARARQNARAQLLHHERQLEQSEPRTA